MKRLLPFLLLSCLLITGSSLAVDKAAEKEAVRQAVLDYVEGIYLVQPERIKRSVHPDLVKRGFFMRKGEDSYKLAVMTFDQLVKLAATWNKDGRVSTDAPKEIEIYDVLDQTAVAKLTAYWGIDYFHLAKYEGTWKIYNVMWQSHPPEK